MKAWPAKNDMTSDDWARAGGIVVLIVLVCLLVGAVA